MPISQRNETNGPCRTSPSSNSNSPAWPPFQRIRSSRPRGPPRFPAPRPAERVARGACPSMLHLATVAWGTIGKCWSDAPRIGESTGSVHAQATSESPERTNARSTLSIELEHTHFFSSCTLHDYHRPPPTHTHPEHTRRHQHSPYMSLQHLQTESLHHPPSTIQTLYHLNRPGRPSEYCSRSRHRRPPIICTLNRSPPLSAAAALARSKGRISCPCTKFVRMSAQGKTGRRDLDTKGGSDLETLRR